MRPSAALRRLATALLLTLVAALLLPASLRAQSTVGNSQPTQVKDSSMLKPPSGAKVAIVEWEDLECPACAHAFPIVHVAADHYHIPLVRYDFQIQGHIWSHDAAIYARYLQDKVSSDLATEYRREVFASQYRINSRDDLHKFTEKFFADNKKPLPFVPDPTGQFAKEVQAEHDLGIKMGLNHTPTVFVVTAHHWIDVTDVSDLYQAIDQAQAEAGRNAASPAPTPRKPTTTARK